MNSRVWLLAACIALGACSQHGAGDLQAGMVETNASEPDAAPSGAEPVSVFNTLFSNASSPSPLAATQSPFVALSSARQLQPAEEIPGEFTAHGAPLPPPRPDFGDRVLAMADESPLSQQHATPPATGWFAALASTFTPREQAAPEEAPRPDPRSRPDAQARARSASLVAYEHKEAGVPLPERAPVSNAGATQPLATPSSGAVTFTPANFQLAGAAAPAARGENGARWRAAYDEVETNCFPERLKQALDRIAAHFNSEVLVTSGRRASGRSGSMHRTCMAADIRVAGVEPDEVARVARTIPGVNGVGTYRRVAVTHVDVREERWAWRW